MGRQKLLALEGGYQQSERAIGQISMRGHGAKRSGLGGIALARLLKNSDFFCPILRRAQDKVEFIKGLFLIVGLSNHEQRVADANAVQRSQGATVSAFSMSS